MRCHRLKVPVTLNVYSTIVKDFNHFLCNTSLLSSTVAKLDPIFRSISVALTRLVQPLSRSNSSRKNCSLPGRLLCKLVSIVQSNTKYLLLIFSDSDTRSDCHFKYRHDKIPPSTRVIYVLVGTDTLFTNITDMYCFVDDIKLNIFQGKKLEH